MPSDTRAFGVTSACASAGIRTTTAANHTLRNNMLSSAFACIFLRWFGNTSLKFRLGNERRATRLYGKRSRDVSNYSASFAFLAPARSATLLSPEESRHLARIAG